MKKLKNEAELVKKAIRVGMIYAEKRGVVKFEASDSAKEKIEYLYRLLVHDNLIQPLAKDQLGLPGMKAQTCYLGIKTNFQKIIRYYSKY